MNALNTIHEGQRLLEWSDVSRAALELFQVWDGDKELDWAQRAWGLLRARGLTAYVDEDERCLVLSRYFALAALYRDFCCLGWDECVAPDHQTWAVEFGLSPVQVLRLGGAPARTPQCHTDEPGPDDLAGIEDSAFYEALDELVARAQREITPILLEHSGGPTGLFLTLWRTCVAEDSFEWDDENEEYREPSDGDIVNDLGLDALPAFEWLTSGAEPNWR